MQFYLSTHGLEFSLSRHSSRAKTQRLYATMAGASIRRRNHERLQSGGHRTYDGQSTVATDGIFRHGAGQCAVAKVRNVRIFSEGVEGEPAGTDARENRSRRERREL